MTTELRLWLSKRKDKLVELMEENKAAELIAMCPVDLREEMYQLLLELYKDPDMDFDDITLSSARENGAWYGLNQRIGTSEAKYVCVKNQEIISIS